MERPIIDSDDEETLIFMEPYCNEAGILKFASLANDMVNTNPREGNDCKIVIMPLNETLAFDNEEIQVLGHSSNKCSNTEPEIIRSKKENRYFKFTFNKDVAKNWRSGFSNYWPNDLYNIKDCLTLRKRFRTRNEETKNNLRSVGVRNSTDSPISILSPISNGSSEDNQQGKRKDSIIKHVGIVNSVPAPESTPNSDSVNYGKSSYHTKENSTDLQNVSRELQNENYEAAHNEYLKKLKEPVIKSTAETSNVDRLSDLCYDPHKYKRCKVYMRGERCKERYCRALHKFPKEDNVYCWSYLKNSHCKFNFSCPYLHHHPESSSLKSSLNKHKSLPSPKLNTCYDDGYSSEEKNSLYNYNKKNTLPPSVDSNAKSHFKINSDREIVEMVVSNKYNGSISSTSHSDNLESAIKNFDEDKIEVSDMELSECTDDEIESVPGSPNNCSEDSGDYKFPVLLGVGEILSRIRLKQNNSEKEKVSNIEKLNGDKSHDSPEIRTSSFLETDTSFQTEKVMDNNISQIRLEEKKNCLEINEHIVSNSKQIRFGYVPVPIEPTKDVELNTAPSEKNKTPCEVLDTYNLRIPVTEENVCHPIINNCGSSKNNLIKIEITPTYSNNNAASDLPCHLDVNDPHSPHYVMKRSHCLLADNRDPNENTPAVNSQIGSNIVTQSLCSLELSKITLLTNEMKQNLLEDSTQQKDLVSSNDDSIVPKEKSMVNCSVLNSSNFSVVDQTAAESLNNKTIPSSPRNERIFETTHNNSSDAIITKVVHNMLIEHSSFQDNNENTSYKVEIPKTIKPSSPDKWKEAVLSETGIGESIHNSKFISTKSDCDGDSSCQNFQRPIMPLDKLVNSPMLKLGSENIKKVDESKLSLAIDSVRKKNIPKKLTKQRNTEIFKSKVENTQKKKCPQQYHDVELLKASSEVNQSIKKKAIELCPAFLWGKESTKEKSDNHRKESEHKKDIVDKGKFREMKRFFDFKSSSSKENNSISETVSANKYFQRSSHSFKIPKLGKKSSVESFAKETDSKKCLKRAKNSSKEETILFSNVSSYKCIDVKKINQKSKHKHKNDIRPKSNKSDSHVTDKNSRNFDQSIVPPLSDNIISNQNINSTLKVQNNHYKPRPKCKKKFDSENESRLQLLKRKGDFSPELSRKKVPLEREVTDNDEHCRQVIARNEASPETSQFMSTHSLIISEKQDLSQDDCLNMAHFYLHKYFPEYDTTDVFKQFEILCEKFQICCIEKSSENNFDILDRNIRRFALKLVALDSGCEADDDEFETSLNDYRSLSLKAFIELINTT